MTITLDLPDAQAAQLTERAAARGQTVAAYLLTLADQAERDRADRDAWSARLTALGSMLPDSVPPLSDEATRRETMYREVTSLPQSDLKRLAAMKALWSLLPDSVPPLSDEATRRETMYRE